MPRTGVLDEGPRSKALGLDLCGFPGVQDLGKAPLLGLWAIWLVRHGGLELVEPHRVASVGVA